WAGYVYLAPWLTPWVAWLIQKLPPEAAGRVEGLTGWAAIATGVAAAVVAGWAVGPPLNGLLGWFLWGFNRAFDWSTCLYARLVGVLLRGSLLVLAVYGGLLFLTYWGFTKTPAGFIPQQDKGYLLVNVQLPDSASLERTDRVMRRIEEVARRAPG